MGTLCPFRMPGSLNAYQIAIGCQFIIYFTHIMILILRGHIRNSMDDSTLLNTMKGIVEKFPDISIFIHSWNVVASSISYRHIVENNTKLTSEYILHYFNDIQANILHIEISDDTSIELIGDTNGFFGSAPKIGWKRMWYGKYKILNIIKSVTSDVNEIVINMRFDINNVNGNILNTNEILSFIENVHNTQNRDIVFYWPTTMCDNFYSGSLENMYILTHDFHTNLGDILMRLPNTPNQEVYVTNNVKYLKELNMFR